MRGKGAEQGPRNFLAGLCNRANANGSPPPLGEGKGVRV